MFDQTVHNRELYEKHYNTLRSHKLTLEQCREIRRLKNENPKMTQAELARMFGVSAPTICTLLKYGRYDGVTRI